ncbi:MAG: hypothetical protein QM734_16490 [Cyclobacteriaceae bacterium]
MLFIVRVDRSPCRWVSTLWMEAERIFYSDRNQYRIPDYLRFDASINVEGNHKIKKLAHSSWTFAIYNLLGRHNVYSVYFVSQNGHINGYQMSILKTDPYNYLQLQVLKMKIKLSYIFIFASVFFAGCKEPYTPPYSNSSQNFLVVDGTINSTDSLVQIKLSRAVPLSSTQSSPAESGASVSVENDQGLALALVESPVGVYSLKTVFSSDRKYKSSYSHIR